MGIEEGEIFALLGANGAGKTTLINIICGLVTASAGQILVGGHDIVSPYKAARSRIGLVPQEMAAEMYEQVIATVNFSRGLLGQRADAAYIEKLMRDLSLWDKRDAKVMALYGVARKSTRLTSSH